MKTLLESRTKDSLRNQYNIERDIAHRLRTASPENRRSLYSTVYNELFVRVPDHPQNTLKADTRNRKVAALRQLRLLRRFLGPDTVYLEVGAGDCHLALTVASQVRHVYAVDVSDIIAAGNHRPANFALVITNGITIDVPSNSAHIAYSNQLLEHLHPDDAAEQLREVLRTLAPGGQYIAVTPHRFSGPHDISRFFDREASGVHLKEYTYRELRAVFLAAGFASTSRWIGIKGRFFEIPEAVMLMLETCLAIMPHRLRTRLARSRLLRPFFADVIIAGRKARA